MSDNEQRDGFTGTVPAFLSWLNGSLSYGHVKIHPSIPDELIPSRTIVPIDMVTGGWSDDEALLGDVASPSCSTFSLMFWESTHRGGLYTYHVPIEHFDSSQHIQWLKPSSNTIEEIHRARTLVVRLNNSDDQFFVIDGARVSFREPERDINCPDGVLTVESIG